VVPGESFDPAEDVRWTRLLLNRLPGLIGYWDRDQRNVFANEAYMDYWGLTPPEVAGRHLREILGDTIYTLNLPHIEAALSGQERSFNRTLIDSRGVTRHTSVSYIPQTVDGRVRGFYVAVTDVTDRVEAEQARGESLRMFEVMVANAPFGKAIFDGAGRVLHVNPALCEVLGCAAEDLAGRDFREFVHPDEVADSEAELLQLVTGASSKVTSVRRYLHADGTSIWMLRSAVLVRGAHRGDDLVVAQYDDATARRHAEAELARMAFTDPLTGLHNRRAFEDWIRVRRGHDPAGVIGVVFVDLDGFKRINDTHGHAVGDAILAEAARSLSRVAQPPSTAYRFGGDEFIVLLPDAEPAQVAELAETMTRALTGRYGDAVPVTLTASVGWTHGAIVDSDQLLRDADADMYRRKREQGGPAGR
jgi:diguanylate cyclase (GGDEF)-like protein/PAS domain S-box-containing protein